MGESNCCYLKSIHGVATVGQEKRINSNKNDLIKKKLLKGNEYKKKSRGKEFVTNLFDKFDS